jgi:hypothetical protein
MTSKTIDPSLYLRSKRLLSSLYDGEVELALKISNLLYPYANVIQKCLIQEVAGYSEVFTNRDVIESALLNRRKETQRRRPAYSRDIILLLQERFKEQEEQEALESSKVSSSKKSAVLKHTSANLGTLQDPHEEVSQNLITTTPPNQNLKKEYRQPSEQQLIEERKMAAKTAKKKNLENLPENNVTEYDPFKVEQQPLSGENNTTAIQSHLTIKIGGGPFKIFNKIVNKTFKGSMEKVILLIEALDGSADEGKSGSRIKFELPHLNHNSMAYLDISPPDNDEDNMQSWDSQIRVNNPKTIHAPHKNKEKKLRFYHVEDVRNFLLNAGYNENTVYKK